MEHVNKPQKSVSRPTDGVPQKPSCALTKSAEPTFVAEIQKKYGDFKSVCMAFEPPKRSWVCANPIKAIQTDTPTLARLNTTYGDGSARQWLFMVLQDCFRTLGVDSTKMSDTQIIRLADTIVGAYYYLSMAEFLLFIARCEAGYYERFYGDASYFLAITKSLQMFMSDRNELYAEVEREKQKEKRENERMVMNVSYPDYVRSHKKIKKEDIDNQARSIKTYLTMFPDMEDEANMVFKEMYGKTLKEYFSND